MTVLSGLWFWFGVIGKDITAELLANNVVEPTKCFLQEPQVLFQYNASHTAPVSTPREIWHKGQKLWQAHLCFKSHSHKRNI